MNHFFWSSWTTSSQRFPMPLQVIALGYPLELDSKFSEDITFLITEHGELKLL